MDNSSKERIQDVKLAAITDIDERFDRVDGEISFSQKFWTQPEKQVHCDTADCDVSSLIQAFLNDLPSLNLAQLNALTLEDPQKALSIINALRKQVEQKLHTARMLRELYLQQHFGQTE